MLIKNKSWDTEWALVGLPLASWIPLCEKKAYHWGWRWKCTMNDILLVIMYGKWNMVPQQNTTTENGQNTMQDWMNNDGTNTVQQKKFKLDPLKDRCHWCYLPNLHATSTNGQGMSCMAEREHGRPNMHDRVVPMKTTSGPRGHPKRCWWDDLNRGYRSKLEPCCQRLTLVDRK